MADRRVRFQQIRFQNGENLEPPIEIVSNDIHLWSFLLEGAGEEIARAALSLSEDEQAQARRFLSGSHRQQFMAAHAVLRVVLSRYCGKQPQELVIRKSSAGKPFLSEHRAIRFNLTHSHGRALIAIAKNREVGVDLEKIRPDVDVVKLAKRFLSFQDQQFIGSADSDRRHERFLQVWVARESVFKAKGSGIIFPLHRDHLELSNDGQDGRLIGNVAASEGAGMVIRFLPLESGWIGAVAAEGTDWTIAHRT